MAQDVFQSLKKVVNSDNVGGESWGNPASVVHYNLFENNHIWMSKNVPAEPGSQQL